MSQSLNSIYSGVPDVLSALRKQGRFADLRELQSPAPLKSTIAFLGDWLVVACAVKIALIQIFPLGFLSLILIGSRQRALSNLVHDASHGNLFLSRKMNDRLANWFAAFAMFDTVAAYRVSHLDHHRYLGTEKDPDSKNHLRYGYDDRRPPSGSRLKVFVSLLTKSCAFRDSILGNLPLLKVGERLMIALWWTVAIVVIGLLSGAHFAFEFFGLWILSRATAYHVIRIFAEFLDHAGLPTGTILSFTRNLPHEGLCARLFHPHEDTYHLVHHLLPKVPHYHLKSVHSLLSASVGYAEAHHCDSYFTGSHSAIRCWSGQCKGGSR